MKLLYFIVNLLLIFVDMLFGLRSLKIVLTEKNIIYGIRKSTSKKTYVYIGKTDTKNFTTRQNTHIRKSLSNKHVNKELSKIIRNSKQNPRKRNAKYSVVFDVLEYCHVDKVFEREAFYISKYDSKRLTNLIKPNG